MVPVILVGIYVFVLSVFVGNEIISKVPPMLHTPLMSGTNAVSGITLVGAVVAAGHIKDTLSLVLGLIAVICGTINVVGGYLVTDRMLRMFKKK
ncbi:MAG: NAD(P) transhydrogenase subunit alpha [Deltaproteobacteria bacterium]|nr:NAD(P) transhydrogenase subunit alpha [Deltaproteobacteria bacterium]